MEQPAAHLANPRPCLEQLQRPLLELHLPHPRRLELQRLLRSAQPRSRTLLTLLRGARRPLAEQIVHCGLKERYLEQEAGHWVRLVAKHVRLPRGILVSPKKPKPRTQDTQDVIGNTVQPLDFYSCPFLLALAAANACRFWNKGSCRFGASCRNQHVCSTCGSSAPPCPRCSAAVCRSPLPRRGAAGVSPM